MNSNHLHPLSEKTGDNWCVDKRIVFDIEARNWTDIVALGALDEYHNDYFEFTADECDPVTEFIDLIMQRKYRGFRIIAHNGGKYDFGFLLDELSERDEIKIDIINRNGSAISIKLTPIRNDGSTNGNCRTLQDSIALLPRPLDTLGEAFCDEGKQDFDVTDIDTPARMKQQNNWSDMLSYLRQDCELLSQVIDGFVNTASELLPGNDRLSPNLTIASTTMEVYRQYYQDQPICHASRDAEEDLRSAYYGGRTEVYRHQHDAKEHGTLRHYDVNSLYPYVYGTQKHPVGKEMYIADPDLDELEDMPVGGVVEIEATVPDSCDFPVLPTREKINGSEKVLFPTGEISGFYELREILYAKQVGALCNVDPQQAHVYALGSPFDSYADELYYLKSSIDKPCNPGKYNVVKLLLNSFWGKFGMARDQSRVVQTSDGLPPQDNDAKPLGSSLDERTRNRERGLFEVSEESEANYILPQVAVSVTALARIEMHKWFRRARNKGGKIWYCDTDSIATNVELETSEELGGMDLETVSDEAYFISPKVYAEKHTDGTITMKAKGMKSDKLRKENSFADYRKAVVDQEPQAIGVTWQSVSSPVMTMRQDDDMHVIERDRNVTRLDDKRQHDIRNNESKPLDITAIREQKMQAEAGRWSRRKKRERYSKSFERQHNASMQAKFDDTAKEDSELRADENKKELWKNRREKSIDRDMF